MAVLLTKSRTITLKCLLRERRLWELIRRGLRRTIIFAASYTFYARWYSSGRYAMFRTMKDDPRFTVSDAQLMSILATPVKKYEVSRVRAGSLKRNWDGQIMPLSETATYAYVINGDEERYRKYVRTVNEGVGITDEKKLADIVEKDLARLKNTTASVMNEGYDVCRSAVVVRDRNIIMDGIHRSCILWKKFGPDYEFPVLRIYYSRLFW